MKLNQYILSAVAAATFVPMANAQFDATYNDEDLILGFQVNPTNNLSLEVNLGSTITRFRDGGAPRNATNVINIGNISTQLIALGGANWFDNTDLYFGAAGNRGVAGQNNSNTAGFTGIIGAQDPNQTIYITERRVGVGSVGARNSNPTGSASTSASFVRQFSAAFDAREVSGIYAGAQTANTWEDFNQVNAGVQATAFSGQTTGVQFNFGAGSFGTFGAAGTVEGVIDLYRQARFVNATNTPDFDTVQAYDYLGSITINQAGDVSFVAVPEPSTFALLGLSALGFFGSTRRRAKKSV